MKRIVLLAVFVITGLFISNQLHAQFSISAEFRPRGEYRDGYSKLRDSSLTPYFDILGRTRLLFDYKSEKFIARFSLQHAFVYGENNYSSDTITRNTVNIYEGWFQYNFSKAFGIKLGRMELRYDDQRLIGISNWNPKGATHDAGLVSWEYPGKGYGGNFVFAVNNTAPIQPYLTPYTLKNYKYMGLIHEEQKFFNDKLTVTLMGILDVLAKPNVTTTKKSTVSDTLYIVNTNNPLDTIGYTVVPVTTSTTSTNTFPHTYYGRITAGGTVGYNGKKLKLFVNGYYQGGHFYDGRKINAGFFGAWASYKIVKPLTVLVGYDYLSGTNYSDTTNLKTTTNSFSTLYGSAHGFYGYMDLFNSYVQGGTSSGLTDLYARATVTFSEKVSFEATWRMFGLTYGYLPSKPTKSNPLPYVSVEKKLGNEFDFMGIYKPYKNFEVNVGYCFYLQTEAMETFEGLKVGTSEWAQFAYVMLTYKPNFFSTEK
jgi:hypothetical protein